jgi:hypothetical protein
MKGLQNQLWEQAIESIACSLIGLKRKAEEMTVAKKPSAGSPRKGQETPPGGGEKMAKGKAGSAKAGSGKGKMNGGKC